MYGRNEWQLDWFVMNTPQSGYEAWITSEDGGWDSPGVNIDASQRINAHGAVLSPVWKTERTINLEGRVYAKNDLTIKYLAAYIKGMCGDPYKTYRLSSKTEIGEIECQVKLNGAILVDSAENFASSVDFSIPLVAADPRLYRTEWQTMTTRLAQQASGGLNFGGSSNLLTNPSFRQNTDQWYSPSAANTTLTRVEVTNPPVSNCGDYGVQVTSSAAGENSLSYEAIAAPPEGVTVTHSMHAWADVNKTLTMYAMWYDSTGAWLSDSSVAVNLTAGVKTRAIISAPAPAGAGLMSFILRDDATASGSTFYATAAQTERGSTATTYSDEFSIQGLDFSSPGLNFGALTSGQSGFVRLRNSGTAPAPVVFTLNGPLTNPVITATDASGVSYSMKYNDTLTDGEYVVITPDHPSVMFMGLSSRRQLLNPANFGGFYVPPSTPFGPDGELRVGLTHDGAFTDLGTLTATWRSASW